MEQPEVKVCLKNHSLRTAISSKMVADIGTVALVAMK